MSKTAITSPNLRRRSARFPRRSKSVVSSISAVRSAKTGHWQGSRGGHCGRDGARLQNLSAVLKAGEKSFDHVVRAGVYLTSMSDYVALNGIYAKHFSQPFPARTVIAVAALPLGAALRSTRRQA